MKNVHVAMNLKIALIKKVHSDVKKSPPHHMLNKAIIDNFQRKDRKNKNNNCNQLFNSSRRRRRTHIIHIHLKNRMTSHVKLNMERMFRNEAMQKSKHNKTIKHAKK